MWTSLFYPTLAAHDARRFLTLEFYRITPVSHDKFEVSRCAFQAINGPHHVILTEAPVGAAVVDSRLFLSIRVTMGTPVGPVKGQVLRLLLKRLHQL